ncbi:MAG: hypothetical protein IPM79_05565 [Polyangiaceae bacterium]|nr:hypothetical protein [Polyangiaceae bacterium]
MVRSIHETRSEDEAMGERMARIARWLVAGGIVTAATPASGQPASAPEATSSEEPRQRAERLFLEGEAAFARGDFTLAGRSFEAANELDAQPTSLFNAARSWERAGEPQRAANLYRRFVDGAPPDTPNRDRATQSLSELAAQLGRLEVIAPGAASLSIDGKPAASGAVFVNPGGHLLTATFPGTTTEERVTVEAGKSLTVLLQPQPAAITTPAPPIEPPAPARTGVSPWLFGGFVAATTLSGGLLLWSGIDTVIARDDYLKMSVAEQRLNYDDGRAKQDRTNVLIGVTSGLAVTSGLIALFAIDWGHGTLVGASPSEVRLVVRF